MVLELLGDYYRVLGVAEQPITEGGAEGTLYYWFEVFRRATIIPTRTPCWHIIIDVYSDAYRRTSEGEDARLSLQSVEVVHTRDSILEGMLKAILDVHNLSLEVLQVGREEEVISVVFTACGLTEAPSYTLLEEVYREIVMYVEGRDVYSQPLWIDVRYLMSYKW